MLRDIGLWVIVAVGSAIGFFAIMLLVEWKADRPWKLRSPDDRLALQPRRKRLIVALITATLLIVALVTDALWVRQDMSGGWLVLSAICCGIVPGSIGWGLRGRDSGSAAP